MSGLAAGEGFRHQVWAVSDEGESGRSAWLHSWTDSCGTDPLTACALRSGTSSDGRIDPADGSGDRDWFEIELAADTEYRFKAAGGSADGELADPTLALYHADQSAVTVAGAPLTDVDGEDPADLDDAALMLFTPETGGVYFVEVAEAGGDDTGTYRVSVTAVNAPPTFDEGADRTVSATEFEPFTVLVAASDDDAEDTATEYSIAPNATDGGADYADFSVNSLGLVVSRPGLRLDYETKPQYEVKVTATTGSGTRAKSAVQTITVIVDDVECAADDTTVCELVAGAAEREDIGSAGADADWFGIDLTGSQGYAIKVSGSDASPSGGTLADPVVKLYDAAGGAVTVSGSVLADSDSDGDGTARISFVPGSTATFYVEVTEDGADAAGSYTIEVAEEANNAPRITNRDLNVSLLENTALSLQVTAVDDDADAVDSYAVVGGSDRALFALDGNGVLTMARNGTALLPDFERPDDLPILGSVDGVYEVEVQVTSGTGARALAASAVFTVTVTDSDDEAPGVPPGLRAVHAGAASLAFQWGPPSNAGPDPVSYALRYRRAGDTAWIGGSAAAAGAGEATSLVAGTEYEAQVRAANAEGDGEWSAPTSAWTDDCGDEHRPRAARSSPTAAPPAVSTSAHQGPTATGSR